MENTSTLLGLLTDILRSCRNGHEGYHQAAQVVTDPQTSRILRAYALRRRRFIEDIVTHVTLLDGDPNRATSILSALSCRMLAPVRGDAGSVQMITVCLQREQQAIDLYKQTLEQELPPTLYRMIETQYQEIQRAVDRLTAMLQTV